MSSRPHVVAPFLPDPLQALAAAINHLLIHEPWARERLSGHTGKSVLFRSSRFTLHLAVTGDGLTEPAAPGKEPDLRVDVPLTRLPLLVGLGREGLLAHVSIEGDAPLAQIISELVAKLRWDAEEDLSRWIGDIAARRVSTTARSVINGVQQSHRKAAENVAEYWLEEDPQLIRPRHVEELAAALRVLRDDLARLEKRVERLEQH